MEGAETGFNEGLSNSIAQLVEKTFHTLMSSSKDGINVARANFALGFKKYVESTHRRCIHVKTLISSSEPILLSEAYEPAILSISDEEISIDEFYESIGSQYNFALITAMLGAGKSFSMKYLYSQFYLKPKKGVIPIFIELRHVPFGQQSLIDHIVQQLSPFTNFIDQNAVIFGLKAGIFALLLDGFDEVAEANRQLAESEILKLAREYPNNIIIVSSRPDRERYVSWHNFPEFNVCPMSQVQLESLIDRIKYDLTDKAIFKKKINSGLYESHQSLLSNPLLASMMLLTFKEFQDIPLKMHVFYGTAFDVLYRKHDATKPEYSRDFRSGLEQDDFRKVFTSFCFYSYLDDYYSFNRESVEYYISGAANQEDIDVNSSHYYYDIKNNMCIMQEEGDDINFIHRSFQEYFAAVYLCRKSIDDNRQFINEIVSRRGKLSAIDMFINMDRQEFERKFFIDRLAEFSHEVTGQSDLRAKINIFYPLIFFRKNSGMLESAHSFFGYPSDSMIRILSNHYGLKVNDWINHVNPSWQKRLPKQLKDLAEDGVVLLSPPEMPIYFIKALGLDHYVDNLISDMNKIYEEIVQRHASKKLSRNLLRRKKTDIVGVS
jgi:hypothetical protein